MLDTEESTQSEKMQEVPRSSQDSGDATATRIEATGSKDTALATDSLPKQTHENATPAGTSSSAAGLVSSPQTARKSIEGEFITLKQGLRRLVLGVERFEKLLADENLVSSATAAVPLMGRQDAGRQGQSQPPRGRGPHFLHNAQKGKGGRHGHHHPIRHQWDLIILEPMGLEPVDSVNTLELKDATQRCLDANGASESGNLETCILKPLIEGSDTILQLRGPRLAEYASYSVIDMADGAADDTQIVILVNHWDNQGTRSMVETLLRLIEISDTRIDVHLIRNLADGAGLKNTSDKPSVFITTPELYPALIEEQVIMVNNVGILLVYEAEYVLRTPSSEGRITASLHQLSMCQVILACHVGTKNIVKASEAFDFDDERVVFSLDHMNLTWARHFWFKDESLMESLLSRAVELSKDHAVVVICCDATETAHLKETLEKKAKVLSVASLAESSETVHGLLVTPQISSRALQNKGHTSVQMILNLSGMSLSPDIYLEMLASYMDAGQRCDVVTKISSDLTLKKLEPLRLTFAEISSIATDLPI